MGLNITNLGMDPRQLLLSGALAMLALLACLPPCLDNSGTQVTPGNESTAGLDGTRYPEIRHAGFVIAALDSDPAGKDDADYVCDGVNDSWEIQNALDSLPEDGGMVRLVSGTYNIDRTLMLARGRKLSGQGFSTVLRLSDGVNDDIIRTREDWATGYVEISDLRLEGNKDDQAAGSCIDLRSYTSRITDVNIYDCYLHGINLAKASENTGQENFITRVRIQGCNMDAIHIDGNMDNHVSDCQLMDGRYGLYMNSSHGSTVRGIHVYRTGDAGVRIDSSTRITLSDIYIERSRGTNGMEVAGYSRAWSYDLLMNNILVISDAESADTGEFDGDGIVFLSEGWGQVNDVILSNVRVRNARYGINLGNLSFNDNMITNSNLANTNGILDLGKNTVVSNVK